VNIPLEAGSVSEDYELAFSRVIVPVLQQFEPDLVIVSAGFDAHEHDPLGEMRLTSDVFGAMTADLRAVADECCRGRLVAVTEGGYDLEALGTSLDASIAALDSPAPSSRWPSSGIASDRGRRAVDAVRRAHTAFWTI